MAAAEGSVKLEVDVKLGDHTATVCEAEFGPAAA